MGFLFDIGGSLRGTALIRCFTRPAARRLRRRVLLTCRDFSAGGRASTTVETALTLASLVVMGGLVVGVVMALYEDDRKSRGAHAVARALALGSATAPCDLVREELGFGADFECVNDWEIAVSSGLKPSEILAETQPGTGNMVVVHIGEPTSDRAIGLARLEPDL